MSFTVKHEKFEGPLDLLLDLIEKRKLFINEISLAKVADDYISYVQNIGNYSIGDTAQFILIASTLVLIKSRSLLPSLSLTEEEQQSVDDLEKRLRIYKRIKELSKYVGEKFGVNIIFGKSKPSIEKVFAPDESMSIPILLSAAKTVLANIPKKEKLPQAVVKKVISLEDMIENLTKRIQSNLKMSFKSFTGGKTEKVEVIVGFLAMLELVKQGIINVSQEKHFEDIQMETEEVGIPTYN